VNLRPLDQRDIEDVHVAGVLLYESFARAARERGQTPPWADRAEAMRLVERYLADDHGEAVVADVDGAVAGVGFVRRRGEAATVGPIAVAAPRRGTGGQILDDLVTRAEAQGAAAIRLFVDGGNADGFALFAGRSFGALDVVAAMERPAGVAPRIDGSRGLEVSAFQAADLAEMAALDLRLTGLDRRQDLTSQARLVARRRGAMVGFVCAEGNVLGPAVALDVSDLGGLVARALADVGGRAVLRLSTATPTAMLVALGLGFRVTSVGTLMVRGVSPPARPPQLYAIAPEVM
jgi:hypothetical protein